MSEKSPRTQFAWSLLLAAVLLLLAFAVFGWAYSAKAKAALTASLREEGEQLATSLQESVDGAQSHVSAMRRSMERALINPDLANGALWSTLLRRSHGVYADAPWESLPKALQSELGTLVLTPGATSEHFLRDVAALATAFPGVAATHVQRKYVQRSNYCDARKRWVWTYPAVARELRSNAVTCPSVDSAGLVWSAPRPMGAGKGLEATLQAPVHLDEVWIGSVGIDVALDGLEAVVQRRGLHAGRAFVVDGTGVVLADSGNSLRGAGALVQLRDVIPGAPLAGDADSAEWLHFGVRGTPWTALLYLPQSALREHVLQSMRPVWWMALFLVLGLLGLAWLLGYRFVRPALMLVDYVEQLEHGARIDPPRVPQPWVNAFKRVQRASNDRRDHGETSAQRARQLQQALKQRNHELRMLQKGGLPESE